MKIPISEGRQKSKKQNESLCFWHYKKLRAPCFAATWSNFIVWPQILTMNKNVLIDWQCLSWVQKYIQGPICWWAHPWWRWDLSKPKSTMAYNGRECGYHHSWAFLIPLIIFMLITQRHFTNFMDKMGLEQESILLQKFHQNPWTVFLHNMHSHQLLEISSSCMDFWTDFQTLCQGLGN